MAVLDFVKNIGTGNYFGGGSLKDNPVIGMKPDLIPAVSGISKTPEQKAEGLSEGDISDAAYEGQQAGYDAVADRVLQMTGLDMKNAEDRAKLCEHYEVDVNHEAGWPSDGIENEFDNALRSYSELAVDEESRGKGDQIDFDALPEKGDLDNASDMTYDRVSSSKFADKIYKTSGLDINSREDNEALSDRIDYLKADYAAFDGNQMLGRAGQCVEYAENHHADIDKDASQMRTDAPVRERVGTHGLVETQENTFEDMLRQTAMSLGVDDTAAQQMLAGASHFVDSLESKFDPNWENAAASSNEGKNVDELSL